ncbi:MAG: ATP-binding protein, partial [Acidobacteria bacterium]|nr:ATP-binding protein [Acidobacteriota bacterium]
VTAGNRIAKIVRSLKNFARLDEAEFQKADLHEGLDSTLTLVHHELKNRAVVVKDYGSLPLVYCSPNQLNQVFMNLFINASQAIEDKGEIRIRTFSDDGKVCVQITDNGKGILPEHLSRIFDPGFTTKGAGVGTGLGLSICYNIIQRHKGNITVQSEPGRGTEFTITLPVQLEGI